MKYIIKLTFYCLTLSIFHAECSDLNYSDCMYWSQYCEWNEDSNQCQEIGGGGGSDLGPYQFATITESDGLRNGPHYRDGTLYYPLDANPPYKSIVITPGWGGGSSSMSAWGEFFASYGFIALTIGPNDEINDSHEQRAEGIIDGIETNRQEQDRAGSPVYGMIDSENFSACGYSMGGGAAQIAAVMDNSLKSVIALNPTVIFEDCSVCTGYDYCICLVPQFLDHPVPTLIFAGENEVNELPSYAGLLGQDHYENTPETTDKILFEGAGGGHGFAATPHGEVADYILTWINYQVLNDNTYCEPLLEAPSTASQYLTNIECSGNVAGDVNGDSQVNIQDIIVTINLVLESAYQQLADLNDDGAVNILDIIQIVNIILTRSYSFSSS